MKKDNHVDDYNGDDNGDLASIHVAEQKLKVVGIDILSQHISDINIKLSLVSQLSHTAIRKVAIVFNLP